MSKDPEPRYPSFVPVRVRWETVQVEGWSKRTATLIHFSADRGKTLCGVPIPQHMDTELEPSTKEDRELCSKCHRHLGISTLT